jgi:hypothetical protein
MVADLRDIIHCRQNSGKANMMCYADDSTLYASSNSSVSLLEELERMSNRMLDYCRKFGLVITGDRTKIRISGLKTRDSSVRVGNSLI